MADVTATTAWSAQAEKPPPRHSKAHRQTVCILCPGGFEHAGGIGRWAQYLFAAWPASPHVPPLVMIDTRGFGGMAAAAGAFGRALAILVCMRLAGRIGLLHINLSVRGSTIRKTIVSSLAWHLGVPTIIHLHSGRFATFFQGLSPWAQQAVRKMYKRSERAIVLGEVWRDMLIDVVGVDPAKIVVLPNAVPDQAPRPARAPGTPCHIVMLGRLGAPKGVPELLQALGSDEMRDLAWRITLAGDGDQTPYREQAAQLGIAGRTEFVGWYGSRETAHLMRSADVLVLPSRSENLPVAVVEALSYGIPVVTTPVGATPEIVVNEESALLVGVQDPVSLAQALARLVRDPTLRQRIGRGGYDVFQARLDIRQAVRVLAGIYRDVLADASCVASAAKTAVSHEH